MQLEGIILEIANKAKEDKKKIVLPESTDSRILKAAIACCENDIADIVLVGKKEEITNIAKNENINLDLEKIQIEDPEKSTKKEEYIDLLYTLRKEKGMTRDMASDLVKDNVYFATLMVKASDADGMVSGAVHSTSDTLRPALQIIKADPSVKNVSSFFIIESPNKEIGKDGKFIFADCGLIEYPTEEQFVDIINSSEKSYRAFIGDDPKVAMLSYSTKGSAKGESIDKIKSVIEKVKKVNKDLSIDGELQLDSAISEKVAKMKAPGSRVAGKANILIFPDIAAGNIGYKIAQRFGNAVALGPITQGLAKPVNDLSRGCSAEDIVGAIAITSIQAKN